MGEPSGTGTFVQVPRREWAYQILGPSCPEKPPSVCTTSVASQAPGRGGIPTKLAKSVGTAPERVGTREAGQIS